MRSAYEESENMKFVRNLTSIPVPRVYAVILLPPWIFWWRRKWVWAQTVRYPDSAFIFMDRIDGQSLDIHTWLSLDDSARDRIVGQLHGYVSRGQSLSLDHS